MFKMFAKVTLNRQLNFVQKLRTFDLSYFNDKRYSGDDESQNYLVFQPLFKSFTTPTDSEKILAWRSEGLSEESIKPPTTSNK